MKLILKLNFIFLYYFFLPKSYYALYIPIYLNITPTNIGAETANTPGFTISLKPA
jgi:hypothetical protein